MFESALFTEDREKALEDFKLTREDQKKKKVELTHAEIRKMGNLGTRFMQIEKLYLSYNYLTDLEGIQNLPNLTHLSLVYNQITEWQEFHKLKLKSKLRMLAVHSNPLCKHPDYRRNLISLFPNLEILDDQRLTSSLRRRSNEACLSLSKKLLPFLQWLEEHSGKLGANSTSLDLSDTDRTKREDLLLTVHQFAFSLKITQRMFLDVNKETEFFLKIVELLVQVIDKTTNGLVGLELQSPNALNRLYREMFRDLSLSYLNENDYSLQEMLGEGLPLDSQVANFYQLWPALGAFWEGYDILPGETDLRSHDVKFCQERIHNHKANKIDLEARGLAHKQNRLNFRKETDPLRGEIPLVHFPCFPFNNTYLRRLLTQVKQKIIYLAEPDKHHAQIARELGVIPQSPVPGSEGMFNQDTIKIDLETARTPQLELTRQFISSPMLLKQDHMAKLVSTLSTLVGSRYKYGFKCILIEGLNNKIATQVTSLDHRTQDREHVPKSVQIYPKPLPSSAPFSSPSISLTPSPSNPANGIHNTGAPQTSHPNPNHPHPARTTTIPTLPNNNSNSRNNPKPHLSAANRPNSNHNSDQTGLSNNNSNKGRTPAPPSQPTTKQTHPINKDNHNKSNNKQRDKQHTVRLSAEEYCRKRVLGKGLEGLLRFATGRRVLVAKLCKRLNEQAHYDLKDALRRLKFITTNLLGQKKIIVDQSKPKYAVKPPRATHGLPPTPSMMQNGTQSSKESPQPSYLYQYSPSSCIDSNNAIAANHLQPPHRGLVISTSPMLSGNAISQKSATDRLLEMYRPIKHPGTSEQKKLSETLNRSGGDIHTAKFRTFSEANMQASLDKSKYMDKKTKKRSKSKSKSKSRSKGSKRTNTQQSQNPRASQSQTKPSKATRKSVTNRRASGNETHLCVSEQLTNKRVKGVLRRGEGGERGEGRVVREGEKERLLKDLHKHCHEAVCTLQTLGDGRVRVPTCRACRMYAVWGH